jgi:hypothetical protein
MKTSYTIEQLVNPEDFTEHVKKFFREEAPKISEMFDNKLNYKNCPIYEIAKKYIFLVCRRDGEMRGYMICFLTNTPLDPEVKILRQLSFYVKPDSGRTAYHLFQKFIDIGKDRANHIITMLTSQTNIKPSTLENYGFKKLETLYRMEI